MKTLFILFKLAVMLILQLLLLETSFCQQEFDSKGKDFWLTFIPNFHNNLTSEEPILKYGDSLYIFITSEVPTDGIIEYYDRFDNYYTKAFTIANPLDIYTFKISYYDFELWGYNSSGSLDERNQSEEVCKMSFHIVSNDEITVYAHSQAVTTSDAFLVLPTDVLGKNYFVMAFSSDGSYLNNNQVSGSSTPSQFAVLATEDNTSITIIPKAPTRFNELNIQNINLNRGEVYLVQANIKPTALNPDLTGTEIISDKPIALFAGHQRTRLPINLELLSRDILIEQIPPIDVWGKNAFIIPYHQVPDASPIGKDIFRVLAANDNTELYLNGSLIEVLNKGEFFEANIDDAYILTSSSPVLVAQFKKTSQDADFTSPISDPFMMLIPPKEQFLKSYRVINTQAMEFNYNLSRFEKVYDEQYITIAIPKNGISSLKIDNTSVDSLIFKEISNSNYSYANIKVTDGVHTAEALTEFGIYIYGYGIANSYGYIGGMGFKPLDIKSPVINLTNECFKVVGVITDTSKSDTGIKEITTEADSNLNTNLNIETFPKYAKIVKFECKLIDNRKDGSFYIKATDSLGYFSSKRVDIPGSTVSYEGIITDTVPIKYIQSSIGIDTCFNIIIKNYGRFPQKIISIKSDNSDFEINFPTPKVIHPNESDTINICVDILKDIVYSCNITIEDECLTKALVSIVINPNSCDITAFDYPDFSEFDYKKFSLIQWARHLFDFVRLSRTDFNTVGSLWYKLPIPIKRGFTTKFKFRFSQGNNNQTDESSYPGADGIAFVIQNVSTDVFGSNGGGIGYNGIPNSLAIEFDVFINDSTQLINFNDPNGNHTAIMCNGKDANSANHKDKSCLATNPNIITIRSDSTIYYSKIEYNIEKNTLKVYLDTTGDFIEPILKIDNIDISQLLDLIDGNKAYLGFTSATGTAWQNHDILSWNVCPVPQSPINVEDAATYPNETIKIYPNPTNNNFRIELDNPKNGKVRIVLTNLIGKEIKLLYDNFLIKGLYSLEFNIDKLSVGSYYIKSEFDNSLFINKLIIGR